MTERSVRVLHVLVSRRIRGTAQVLLFRHPRWLDPRTRRSMMALPTTKFAEQSDDSDKHVGERLVSLLQKDTGLANLTIPSWQRLGDAQARIVSPTHGVPSTYNIAPVLARLPVASHARVARQLGGEWHSLESALGQGDLSPTARAVFEQHRESAWLIPATVPDALFDAGSDPALTARLLAARDGDVDQFWALIQEIRPALIARLRDDRRTRSMSNRVEEVEDVLADAAVRALEKLEKFNPDRGMALAWLWILTRNLAVDRFRLGRRTSGLSLEQAEALLSGERDPASLMVTREAIADLQARVARALNKAKPRMRDAWAMRIEEERRYEEIAEVLHVPMGTVATWIRRIRTEVQADGQAASLV